MPDEYLVPEVSPELVADVSKTLANSPSPMPLAQIANCYTGQYSDEYVRRAVIGSMQLGLVESKTTATKTNLYVCAENCRDLLKKSTKSEMKVPFRIGLQNYGPFLLYADYLDKGFSSSEAAIRTKGLFKIPSSPEKVEKSLRSWGKYSELIEESATGPRIKVSIQHLAADYVKKLVDALEAELQAKLFTIDMLGPEVFTFLDNHEVKLDDLAKALRNYESDPKPSAARSLQIYERFIHVIANEHKVDTTTVRDLSGWLDQIKKPAQLPNNLFNFCKGMAALRNMTHHNPDADTGKEWNISKQAALTSTLFVPITIRAVYLWNAQRKQEL